MGRRASGKRERLISAAVERFHRDGLYGPSIAEIARDAEVPVGNVFYYFQTRDDLVLAVLDYWVERIESTLASLLPEQPAKRRLEAFLDGSADRADRYAAIGCPLVGLARDLRHAGPALSPLAQKVIIPQIDWICRMFEAMGASAAEARIHARGMLAALQGSFQLAFALGDPVIVVESVARLKQQLVAPFQPTA